MSKNIVVFSDGTGQKGGVGANTNVYKLFNMIEDRTDRQIAYYDAGLGTDWRKISGSISGRGFSGNVIDCYTFIFENFRAGDNIYLFGFSRGAATVRSLSYFIHLFGILPKSRSDLIKQAFKIYKIGDKEKMKNKARIFINKHHTMWTKIRFIGVWDTVAALGLPAPWLSYILDRFMPHHFHSYELSEGIEFARHALSIDEERKTFNPVLWDDINDKNQNDRLKQVWFCGVHTDVGGGYKEDDLSTITLKWMIKEATNKGLIIYKQSPTFTQLLNSSPDINGIMHNEQKKFPGKLFRQETRQWGEDRIGKPCVHMSVFDRTKNNSNTDNPEYYPWILKLVDRDDPSNEPWDNEIIEEKIDIDPERTADPFRPFRANEDWNSMIDRINEMSPILKQTVFIQEQLGFAYNRLGDHKKAEDILKSLIEKNGPRSETNGILGRVYKDLWKKNETSGDMSQAKKFLSKAINCYLQGFEADNKDAYPGINAITLMELTDPIDSRQKEIFPAVINAVNRRLELKHPDYWDYATLLEINILRREKRKATHSLSKALSEIQELWEPKTTANNLKMIIDVRKKRNENVAWIENMYKKLLDCSKKQ